MDKKKQLDHWKKLYRSWEKREEEIGAVLSGEGLYMFELLDYIEPAIRDLYSLDESDWNDDLIYDYLNDRVSFETFESYIVKEGGNYDGLRMMSSSSGTKYWREPYVIIDNN